MVGSVVSLHNVPSPADQRRIPENLTTQALSRQQRSPLEPPWGVCLEEPLPRHSLAIRLAELWKPLDFLGQHSFSGYGGNPKPYPDHVIAFCIMEPVLLIVALAVWLCALLLLACQLHLGNICLDSPDYVSISCTVSRAAQQH